MIVADACIKILEIFLFLFFKKKINNLFFGVVFFLNEQRTANSTDGRTDRTDSLSENINAQHIRRDFDLKDERSYFYC